MSSIRVLHIFEEYPPVISGYSRRSHEIIKQTIPFAKSVVIAPPPRHGALQQKQNYENQAEAVYRLRKFPFSEINRTIHLLISRISIEFLIHHLFREQKMDLVHAHTPSLLSFPVLRLAKKMGVKSVYEVRGAGETAANAEKKTIKPRAEEAALRLADKVVVVSEKMRQELAQRGIPSQKIEVISNGADCAFFRPQTHSNRLEIHYQLKGKLVLGYLGMLHERDGLQTMFGVLSKLLNQNEKIVFLVVGGGEYETALRQLAKDLNLEGHVVFTGAVSPEETAEYYSVMDFVIFPAHSSRVTERVAPQKLFEAMAMGKCVLASKVGGLAECLQDGITASLFDPGNANQIAETILRFAKNPDARRKFGESARKWIEENRDWKNLGQQYQNLYSNLLHIKEKAPLA